MMKCYYDKFRQSPEIIRRRLGPYTQYFRMCKRIVDLGCGRGEFLDLLRNENLEAIGVDSDSAMVEICTKAGLNALCEDIFSFLERGDKYDGISASHVIEHLDSRDAERLLDACYKSLSSGGRLLIITPNPENLLVISKTFWFDLTHVRPYPLILLEEMFKESGFSIVCSGEDPATRGHIRWQRLRMFLAKITLPIIGMKPLWNYLHAAQDIFIVGEKNECKD